MGKTLDYKSQVLVADLSQEFGVVDERGRQVGCIAVVHTRKVEDTEHCHNHKLESLNVGDVVWCGYVHAARVVNGKLTAYGACNSGYIEFNEKDIMDRVQKAIDDCKKRYQKKYSQNAAKWSKQ